MRSDTFTCIFCNKEKNKKDNTLEHVFPEAICGRLKISNVCKDCNSRLGTAVDSYLINNPFFLSKCQDLKLTLENGKIPNIFEKGVLNSNKNRKVYYRMDDNGKPNSIYITPDVKNIKEQDEIRFSVDVNDRDKLVEMVNKSLTRKGLSKKTAQEIFRQSKTFKETPEISYKFQVDIPQFKRSILKIAYELGYYWLGSKYLEDKIAEQSRTILLEEKFSNIFRQKNPTPVFIKHINASPVIDNILQKEEDIYLAIMLQINEFLFIYINFLNCIEGLVLISENSECYSGYRDMILTMFPRKKNYEQNVFLTELRKIGDEQELFKRFLLYISDFIKKFF